MGYGLRGEGGVGRREMIFFSSFLSHEKRPYKIREYANKSETMGIHSPVN